MTDDDEMPPAPEYQISYGMDLDTFGEPADEMISILIRHRFVVDRDEISDGDLITQHLEAGIRKLVADAIGAALRHPSDGPHSIGVVCVGNDK